MTKCPELAEFDSGQIEHILLTSGHNAQDAGVCRANHNALIERLKELQEEGGQGEE